MLTRFKDIAELEVELHDLEYPDKDKSLRLPINSSESIITWINDATWQIFEVAKSAFVSRSYNALYNLCQDEIVYESVSAHTNLVSAIATWAFDMVSITNETCPTDGYSFKEIQEAIKLHDLSENEIGDIPDNGDHNEAEKNAIEMAYYKKYVERYHSVAFSKHVLELLSSMQNKDSFVGRMIYLSDKVAALIITLCLDEMGHPPLANLVSPWASTRDRAEMRLCDNTKDGMRYASEMWTMDFFEMRKLCQYDDTMFFVALIIAATLRVKGRWYRWREKSYKQ